LGLPTAISIACGRTSDPGGEEEGAGTYPPTDESVGWIWQCLLLARVSGWGAGRFELSPAKAGLGPANRDFNRLW